MSTQEFSVRSYGLAMFLTGSGFRPLRAERGGNGSVSYIFVREAQHLLPAFAFARQHLELCVTQLERAEAAQ